MSTDTRIIQRHAGYDVLAQQQTIAWPGGSSVGLHPVHHHGRLALFLRALQHDTPHWIVVDLRDLAPSTLAADAEALPRHDAYGVALYALRLGFSGAAQFRAAAVACCRAAWTATAPAPHTQQVDVAQRACYPAEAHHAAA